MIELMRVAGCLCMICGAGAAIGTLLARRRGTDRPLGLGWSYLLGVSLVAALLHVPLAIDGTISHGHFMAVMCLCAALTAWFVWRRLLPLSWWAALRDGWLFDLPLRPRLVIVAVFGCGIVLTLNTPLTTYDARSAFALKARILYDIGTMQGEDFQDVNRLHFNAPYPLLIPLVEAQVFWAQGSMDDRPLRLVFLLFVAALVSVVVGELRRYENRKMAAWWGVVLLCTPMVISAFEGGGLSGSADLPVACFITAGVIELCHWLRQPESRRAAAAGIMFGAAAVTKPEGAIWAGMACGAAALTLLVRRETPFRAALKTGPLVGVCFVIALAISMAARRDVPPSPYYRNYADSLSVEWLMQIWHRPLEVLLYALQDYGRLDLWNLFWPAALLGLCLKRLRGVPKEIWFARAAVLLIAAAFFAIFVLTPYHLYFQLRTAFGRLSLHFMPIVLIVLAEHLAATGWLVALGQWFEAGRKAGAIRYAAALKRSRENVLALPAGDAPLRRAG